MSLTSDLMQGRTEVAAEGVTVVVRRVAGSGGTEKPSGSRMAFLCDGQSLASLKSPYILYKYGSGLLHPGRGRISKDDALDGRNLVFARPLGGTYASLAMTKNAIGGPFGFGFEISDLSASGRPLSFRFS